jgi:hypothetical protein
MTNFEYRTFLLPQLLVKLGAFSGMAPDRDYLGNNFMAGQVAPENANQLVSFIHPVAILLNVAGYQLEAVALAAYDETGSAGVYIDLTKAAYMAHNAPTSASTDALQFLIGENFPDEEDLCLALRITPRPKWWGDSASEQYFSLNVRLDNVNVFDETLNMTEPHWLLLGGTATGFPTDVGIHHVMTPLTNILNDLQAAIADALATEWTEKSLDQRGGLLKYLNPTNWGDVIAGDTRAETATELQTHHSVIYATCTDVYNWLETLDENAFRTWLTSSSLGSFKETIRIAQSNKVSRHSTASLSTAIETVFLGTHSYRDWIKYQHMWSLLGELDQGGANTLYIYILMVMEELTVIDMLGRVRQTNATVKITLPFDITGHYEQVIPPDSPDTDTGTYDFHTLQLNQAGIYAQGHWQERQQTGTCEDEYNGGRYVRFKHYRCCLDVLPQQGYEAGLTEIYMRVYRWDNPNFISTKPYLKRASAAQPEVYCDKEAPLIGTVRITKINRLPLDALESDPSAYDVAIPDYSVELEFTLPTETLLFRRTHSLPYLAQPDLIQVPDGSGRERLVISQRFPLHSLDKIRILAAVDYLVAGLGENVAAFSTLSFIDDEDPAHDAITQIDHDFAEWMARYACVNVNSSSNPSSPQLEQIQTLIVQLLAQRKVLDDENIEALTLLSVFLQRPIHADLMPYTRKILGPALPKRTPEMEEAVNQNTAGLHVYKWGTNGLGEEGQAKGLEILTDLGSKGVRTFSKILKVLVDFEKNVLPIFSIEMGVFLLDIEKITPFSTENPGWAPGEIHRYLGFQLGLCVSPPGFKGIYLNADSTQLMYASVNWDPGDFTGSIMTFALSAGLVIDFYPLPFLRVDVNSWLESKLENWSPVELLCQWLQVDPQNLKIGTSLSATIFFGNLLEIAMDQELRVPIVSRGLNWVDYSSGLAYILEATAVSGAIFHIPEWINGTQATEEVIEEVLNPIEPLEWRVIESNTPPYQTANEIDEWELQDADKLSLQQMVAEYLYSFRSRTTKLTITGHASPIGPESYNLWLSQKRAQSVYDYIRSLLTDDEYLILPQNTVVQGYGELYANMFSAAERDSSWQTARVYVNGQLVLQIGESIVA